MDKYAKYRREIKNTPEEKFPRYEKKEAEVKENIDLFLNVVPAKYAISYENILPTYINKSSKFVPCGLKEANKKKKITSVIKFGIMIVIVAFLIIFYFLFVGGK